MAFASAADAAEAQKRNGADVLGRLMRVAAEAKRVVPRTAAADASAGGAGSVDAVADVAAAAGASCTRAYVTGLPYDAQAVQLEAELRSVFKDCGAGGAAPLRVRLGLDRASGAFRGYAHVDFADPAQLEAALALSGALVAGRPVRVTKALDKPGKAQQAQAARPPRGHARGRSDGGEA